MPRKRFSLLFVMLLLCVCGCVPSPAPEAIAPATASHTPPATAAPIPASPTAPRATSSVQAAPAPSPSGTPLPQPLVCSPLAGYTIADLPGMITNPFNPPPPGSDDPHQAIDVAVRLAGSQVALAGNPVQAVLAGTVAAVISNRFPYGNAILVETQLENISLEWQAHENIPTPAPTLPARSALTCPAGPPLEITDPARRSLYVLYAHLLQSPELRPGDAVTCGQVVGQVGDSGNALNPHLHLEVRVGPAAIRPGSLSHYDAGATEDEMRAYCLWRVSGLFQLLDPRQVLQYPLK